MKRKAVHKGWSQGRFLKLLIISLLFFLTQSCKHTRENPKKNNKTSDLYLMAKIKPLSLLCFAKEDLEKVIVDPRKLGFLANEGKCFLEEKAKNAKVITRLSSSAERKDYSILAVLMDGLEEPAHLVSKNLVFGKIWQRVLIPEERLLSKCATKEQCKDTLDRLEKEKRAQKKLNGEQVKRAKKNRISKEHSTEENSLENSLEKTKKLLPRLYPLFFNWR